MKAILPCVLIGLLGTSVPVLPQAAAIRYENNLTEAKLGELGEEFMRLEGQFKVRDDAGNRMIELPGAPLETFGFLFGPTVKDQVSAEARMRGTAKGRRAPAFAVSLNGVSGHRLRLSAAKGQIELVQADEVIASAPFSWQSGKWTHLRITLRKSGATSWRVEGRAWMEASAAPAQPQITCTLEEPPITGRPGIWGSPFSGTPIQFDDLKVFEDAGQP